MEKGCRYALECSGASAFSRSRSNTVWALHPGSLRMAVEAPRVTVEEFDRIAQDGSGFLEIYDFVAEEICY